MHRNDVVQDGDDNQSPISLSESQRTSIAVSADYQQSSSAQQIPGGTNSSGSSASSHQNNAKTGRKGDPRMHRAVAARLANPKISLFEALRIGGFDYVNDNDANAVDSEQITLGQRKNQLSRRVRLARQQKKEQHLPPTQSLADKSERSTSSRTAASSETASTAARVGGKSTQSTTNVAGTKRPFVMEDGDGGLSEDPAAKMNEDVQTGDSGMAEQSRIMAKNHPGYHPILLQQHLTGPLTAGNGDPQQNGMVNGYLVNPTFDQGAGAPSPFPLPQPALTFGDSGFSFGAVPSTGQEAPNFNLMFPSPSAMGNAMTGGGVRQGNSADPQPQQQQQQQQQLGPASFVGGAPAPQQQLQQQPRSTAHVAHGTLSRSNLLSSTSARPGPHHPQEQAPPAPAGVTIASLNQTAASVGMSLEQLALALRNSNNLSQILVSKGSTPTQAQQDLAVSLYQTENRALYQRSMLLAGFSPEIAQDERSPQYLQMALNAWQTEGQRLNFLMNQTQGLMDPPLEANAPASGPGPSGGGGGNPESRGYESRGSSSQEQHQRNHGGGHSHSHNSHHHHGHDHHHEASGGDGGCAFEGGRHIHRLEGKCGHKAILHQPTDGTAHIDFVVGNRVECYHGVEPLSSNSSQKSSSSIKIWPSNYKCKDLSCKDNCRESEFECKSKKENNNAPSDCCVTGDPKILDLDDIDLDGSEWNSDFSNGETVLGLFKLGAETKAAASSNARNKSSRSSAAPIEADAVNE